MTGTGTLPRPGGREGACHGQGSGGAAGRPGGSATDGAPGLTAGRSGVRCRGAGEQGCVQTGIVHALTVRPFESGYHPRAADRPESYPKV